MEFSYESGAVLYWAWATLTLVRTFFLRFSTLDANMRHLGRRRSFMSGEIQEGGSAWMEIPGAILVNGLFGLLSWVAVALEVARHIWLAQKDYAPPRRVCDLRWRLRNVPLDEQEVRAILDEIADIGFGSRIAKSMVIADVNQRADDGNPYSSEEIERIRRQYGID